MAAVLAFCKLQASPATEGIVALDEVAGRIARGKEFLDHALQSWNVQSTVHVGFEVLVPSLLALLRYEGHDFHFSGRATLIALNKRKMERIKPTVLYAEYKTTLLHSLEAFINQVDMNRICHHLENGSMMGSPSSTAAYLISVSDWDNEAEAYLRFVVDAGHGAVPSAFPTPVFETTWVFIRHDLGLSNTSNISSRL